MGALRLLDGTCGHAFPNVEAFFTPNAGLTIGTGDLKRSEPTGGWANGTPSQRSMPPDTDRPLKVPAVVRTSRGDDTAARGDSRDRRRNRVVVDVHMVAKVLAIGEETDDRHRTEKCLLYVLATGCA